MLAFNLFLLAASVVASPHELFKHQARAASTCTNHMVVFSALKSYTGAASFCSQELGISPVTFTATSTSTINKGSTVTVRGGTILSTAPSTTTSTTLVVTSYSTPYRTAATPTTIFYATVTTTLTSASGAKLPACAVSATAAGLEKRSASVTPSQLTQFPDPNLSAGCSCLSLTTQSITTTKVATVTVSSVRTVVISGGTTSVSTPISRVTFTTTTVTKNIITRTPSLVSTTSTIRVTKTTTVAGTVATPTAFYLESSHGTYVSIAAVAGGALYVSQTSASGADLFAFNSANQLVVVTPGSRYNGYIAVGTPPGQDPAYDWYALEVTKSGSDGSRPALCCGMTGAHLLTCGAGEVFADCYQHGLFEGPAAATTADYYYAALQCSNVTLSIVTS